MCNSACGGVLCVGELLWLHFRIPFNKCAAWVLTTERSVKITKIFQKLFPFSNARCPFSCCSSPSVRYFTVPTRTSSGSRGTLDCTLSDFSTHTRPAGLWIWPDTLSIICSHTSAMWPRINVTSLPTGGSGNAHTFCSVLFCLYLWKILSFHLAL